MRAMTMEEAPKVKAMRKDVESTVREGGCPTHRLAKKYSDSWFPGEITAETIGGCYQLHARRDSSAACGCLCLVCPLCLYQQKCSEDCVCLWPFLWGIPTALCCVVMPMCERDENGWVMRDKQRDTHGRAAGGGQERRDLRVLLAEVLLDGFPGRTGLHGQDLREAGPDPPVRWPSAKISSRRITPSRRL